MDTSFQAGGPRDRGRCRFPADVCCFGKMLIWPMSSFQLLDFLPSFPQEGQQTARLDLLFRPFSGALTFPSAMVINSTEVRGYKLVSERVLCIPRSLTFIWEPERGGSDKQQSFLGIKPSASWQELPSEILFLGLTFSEVPFVAAFLWCRRVSKRAAQSRP